MKLFSKKLLAITLAAASMLQVQSASASLVYENESAIAKSCALSVYQWHEDTAPPKAIVVLLHGFTQQGLSLQVLAEHLAQEHFLVLSMDLRGHGRWYKPTQRAEAVTTIGTQSASAQAESCENAGNADRDAAETANVIAQDQQTEFSDGTSVVLPDLNHVPKPAAVSDATKAKLAARAAKTGSKLVDYYASVDDLEKLCKSAKEQYPGIPLFCIGESSGSGVAARASSRKGSSIDGLILCSPGSRPRIFNLFWVVPDFLKYCATVNTVPISVQRYVRKYASNDPRVTDEMVKDPLSRDKLTGRELFRTLFFITKNAAAVKHINPKTPVLMVQGKHDHIVSPYAVKHIMTRHPSTKRQLVVFRENGHVMLGTSFIKPEVVRAIDGWLDIQIHRDQLSLK